MKNQKGEVTLLTLSILALLSMGIMFTSTAMEDQAKVDKSEQTIIIIDEE